MSISFAPKSRPRTETSNFSCLRTKWWDHCTAVFHSTIEPDPYRIRGRFVLCQYSAPCAQTIPLCRAHKASHFVVQYFLQIVTHFSSARYNWSLSHTLSKLYQDSEEKSLTFWSKYRTAVRCFMRTGLYTTREWIFCEYCTYLIRSSNEKPPCDGHTIFCANSNNRSLLVKRQTRQLCTDSHKFLSVYIRVAVVSRRARLPIPLSSSSQSSLTLSTHISILLLLTFSQRTAVTEADGCCHAAIQFSSRSLSHSRSADPLLSTRSLAPSSLCIISRLTLLANVCLSISLTKDNQREQQHTGFTHNAMSWESRELHESGAGGKGRVPLAPPQGDLIQTRPTYSRGTRLQLYVSVSPVLHLTESHKFTGLLMDWGIIENFVFFHNFSSLFI